MGEFYKHPINFDLNAQRAEPTGQTPAVSLWAYYRNLHGYKKALSHGWCNPDACGRTAPNILPNTFSLLRAERLPRNLHDAAVVGSQTRVRMRVRCCVRMPVLQRYSFAWKHLGCKVG